ncbi:uncharacterized protein LOC124302130 [Neodiprion virginianus]|uniref:uncharacterized protein LOC124302130 n=1 Tax=Neodiprion virginianus TaxID=2961670 RepID=UPI001EE73FF1|nr:uncharacterized protein LOC124302130 [Neodiprion virginianus]
MDHLNLVCKRNSEAYSDRLLRPFDVNLFGFTGLHELRTLLFKLNDDLHYLPDAVFILRIFGGSEYKCKHIVKWIILPESFLSTLKCKRHDQMQMERGNANTTRDVTRGEASQIMLRVQLFLAMLLHVFAHAHILQLDIHPNVTRVISLRWWVQLVQLCRR